MVEVEVMEMMVVVGYGEGARTRKGDDRVMLVMWLDRGADQGGGGRTVEVGRLETVLTVVLVVAVW